MTESFRGLGVCSGVAFGQVQVIDRRRLSVPRHHLQTIEIEPELERFERAVRSSEEQLAELKLRAQDSGLKDVAMLLEAHGMILRDEFLNDATKSLIRDESVNAEWALTKSVKKLREIFDNLDEDYFRERRSDVDLVSDRLMRNLVGEDTDTLPNLPEDAIVVAYELSPADTVALARYSVRAFVTETGGRTSHIAIVAKDMNLPAVVKVPGIMERAGTGDEILVDGASGEVVLRPTASSRERFEDIASRQQAKDAQLRSERDLPASTIDGVEIELLGNIEVAEELPSVEERGGRGVGLYRTEFLVLERERMPTEDEHLNEYLKVVRALPNKPITIRTVDIGGDKFLPSGVDVEGRRPAELNPALGLRAIRYSLRDPDAFVDQVKAILRASAEGTIRILLPFVTGVEEVRKARALIERAKSLLREAGQAFDENIPVGVMIETPAAVFAADLLAREADFFSIGTNDLIQYALAVDRSNEDVAYLYRPCQPAVLRMLEMVVRAARQHELPVTVCGEMAADPIHAPLLIGLGIRSLSLSAASIPLVKRVIRKVRHADAKALVELAMVMPTASDVEAELRRSLLEWAPDFFGSEPV